MDKVKRIQEFNRIWDIPIKPSPAFKAFRNRVIHGTEKIIGISFLLDARLAKDFLALIGEEVPYSSKPFNKSGFFSFNSFDEHPVYLKLLKSRNEKEIAYYLQIFLWVISENGLLYDKYDKLLYEIKVAVALSPGVKIKVVDSPDLIDIYPHDPSLLNKLMIDETLRWLLPFKPVYAKYEKSVNLLRKNNPSDFRDVVDNCRWALELLMKEILENDKSLEKQNEHLGKYLEKRNIHTELRSLFCQTVNYFVKYNNNWVKHPDKKGYNPSASEIEFIVYQTGTLMRLLTQLEDDRKRKEITDKESGKQ